MLSVDHEQHKQRSYAVLGTAFEARIPLGGSVMVAARMLVFVYVPCVLPELAAGPLRSITNCDGRLY